MARKYVCKIKEQVMAAMERLHKRGDSGSECGSMLDALPGLGDRWDLGVKEDRELKLIMGTEIDILKEDSKTGEITVLPTLSGQRT